VTDAAVEVGPSPQAVAAGVLQYPLFGTITDATGAARPAYCYDGVNWIWLAMDAYPTVAALQHSRFVPWSPVNPGMGTAGMYTNPLTLANRTSNNPVGQLTLHLAYSGPAPISIDQFCVNVTAAGAAGAVVRPGLYQIANQQNPWLTSNVYTWATLLYEGPLIDTTGTGARTVTFSPVTVPAYTWFAVGGADQVASATRTTGNFGNGVSTGFGVNSNGYASASNTAVYMSGVPGPLPANFVITALWGTDDGVAFRRAS
jgi:hypothetical protein